MYTRAIAPAIVLGALSIIWAGCSGEARGEEHQDHHAQPAHRESAQPGQGATDPVLAAYLRIEEALAADSTAGVAEAAAALGSAATAHQGHGGAHGEVAAGLISAAGAFRGADLEAARRAFRTLSEWMVRYRDQVEPRVRAQTYVIHCAMADADWLQTTPEVANPYYGASMHSCGEVTAARGEASGSR